MTKILLTSFFIGGAFILPLTFLQHLWAVAAYFIASGIATLIAGCFRSHRQINLNGSLGIIFLGLMLYSFDPALQLESAILIALGCGAASYALLEQLSRNGTISSLLKQQLFVSLGNALVPISISFGMSTRLIAIIIGAACIAFAVSLHFQNSRLDRPADSVESTSPSMAIASGLATTIQFSYIYAAQQIVDSPAAVFAVWVGASVGTVIGRVLAVVFVRYLNWRAVASLSLVTAVSTPIFTLDGDPVLVFIISLIGVIAIAPALPLLIANSFMPATSGRRHRSSQLFESGPLSLAVSSATAGILPVILAITRFEFGWVMATAAIGLAAILFRLGRQQRQNVSADDLISKERK